MKYLITRFNCIECGYLRDVPKREAKKLGGLKREVKDKLQDIELDGPEYYKIIRLFAIENVGLDNEEKTTVDLRDAGESYSSIAKTLKTRKRQVIRIFARAQKKIKRFVFCIAPFIPSNAFFNYHAIDYGLEGGMIGTFENGKYIPGGVMLDIDHFFQNLKWLPSGLIKGGKVIPLIELWKYQSGGTTKYKSLIRKVRHKKSWGRITVIKSNGLVNYESDSIQTIIKKCRGDVERQMGKEYEILLNRVHYPLAKMAMDI